MCFILLFYRMIFAHLIRYVNQSKPDNNTDIHILVYPAP